MGDTLISTRFGLAPHTADSTMWDSLEDGDGEGEGGGRGAVGEDGGAVAAAAETMAVAAEGAAAGWKRKSTSCRKAFLKLNLDPSKGWHTWGIKHEGEHQGRDLGSALH